jgi:hypothetical protein
MAYALTDRPSRRNSSVDLGSGHERLARGLNPRETAGNHLASWPRGAGWNRFAFEDLYAPDAFGVQLVGRGLPGRGPAAGTWTSEPLGKTAVLASHYRSGRVDCPAVRRAAALPDANEDRTPPDVLTRARTDLAEILDSPGVLNSAGSPDLHK